MNAKWIWAAGACVVVLAGCGGTAAASQHAQPSPASCSARERLTDPYLDPAQVNALCAGRPIPAVVRTVTVRAPFTVPCTQGASVALIVGQEPPGATVVPMACTISLNPDWGGLTVTAPNGLSVSLTGPAGGY
jgi:hypothetical protein